MSRSSNFRSKKEKIYNQLQDILIDLMEVPNENIENSQKKMKNYIQNQLGDILEKIDNPSLITNVKTNSKTITKNNYLKNENINLLLFDKKNFNVKLNNKNLKNIKKFTKINVPGDGACGYHSIMKSLEENYGRNNLLKIFNPLLISISNSNRTKFRQILESSEPIDGFLLKKMLVAYLKAIPEKYLEPNLKNITSNDNLRTYNFYSDLVQPVSLLTNNRYVQFKNLSDIPLLTRVNKMIKTIDDRNTWIDHDVFLFITKATGLCINIYDNERKSWLVISPFKDGNTNKCIELPQVYIQYNGSNHYDALKKKGNLGSL